MEYMLSAVIGKNLKSDVGLFGSTAYGKRFK